MPSWIIFGVVLWALFTVVMAFIRWVLALPAAAILAIMVLLVIADKSHVTIRSEHHGDLTVTDYQIKSSVHGAPLLTSNILPGSLNWLSLSIRNTDSHEHPVSTAVCSIVGPVYYEPKYYQEWRSADGWHPATGSFVTKTWAEGSNKVDETYLGKRRMIVRMVAVASTKLADGWRMPMPVIRADGNQEIAYLLAFPKLRLFADDVVEWCKFGATVADLPQDQLEPRVEWVGPHRDIAIRNVFLDADVSPQIVSAVGL